MLNLCNNDKIVDSLRNVFHANIVAIPESRIQPLVIVAASKDTTSFRGAILPLLTKPTTFTSPQVSQSTMPNISGTKTRAINLDLGLQILGNFLKGFGIPSIDLSPSFEGASKVSFSFNNVVRFFIDINELGEHVVGSVLNKENPSASIFFQQDKPFQFYILDSAITSSDFSVNVEQSKKPGFKINLPTISQIITNANANVSVTSASTESVTFKGDKQLGFAFSCVHASFDQSGKFTSLEPGGVIPNLEAAGYSDPDRLVAHTPDHVLLTRDPMMISADFSEFAAASEEAVGAAGR